MGVYSYVYRLFVMDQAVVGQWFLNAKEQKHFYHKKNFYPVTIFYLCNFIRNISVLFAIKNNFFWTKCFKRQCRQRNERLKSIDKPFLVLYFLEKSFEQAFLKAYLCHTSPALVQRRKEGCIGPKPAFACVDSAARFVDNAPPVTLILKSPSTFWNGTTSASGGSNTDCYPTPTIYDSVSRR